MMPSAKYIRQVTTSDGHLRGTKLIFSEGLNCIIGARGTCKSTIVETVRFVFDDDPERVDVLTREAKTGATEEAHRGLIRATLRSGVARVDLDQVSDHGAEATISVDRSVGSDPRIYADGMKMLDDRSALSEIEIYSQGELQEIALDPSKRLALVDRPHKADIDQWLRAAADLAGEVARLGPEIREVREAIATAERILADGEETRAALLKAQSERPELSPEVVRGREAFQRRERAQAVADRLVSGVEAEVSELQEVQGRLSGLRGELSHLTNSGSAALAALAESLDRTFASINRAAHEAADDRQRQDALETARAEYQKEAARYAQLIQREQEVTEALRREDALAEEIERLDRVRGRMRKQQVRRDELESRRSEKRALLKDLRGRVYRRRLEEVDRINSVNSANIVLALDHGSQSSRFRDRLDEMLSGSRLRERAAICEQIATVMTAERLIAIVDAEDADALSRALNRDHSQMSRLISYLADSSELYSLEEQVADDELRITLFVDGAPRPVNEMSKGQKATAILPLVLRDAPYPLILDQPEDDLDNRFIFDDLVKRVRGLKLERQLIFVTHNANIPVIGEADRIFVMSMEEPDRAELHRVGNVDDVKDEIIGLLEGGPEAFEIRRQRYGIDEEPPTR